MLENLPRCLRRRSKVERYLPRSQGYYIGKGPDKGANLPTSLLHNCTNGQTGTGAEDPLLRASITRSMHMVKVRVAHNGAAMQINGYLGNSSNDESKRRLLPMRKVGKTRGARLGQPIMG